MVLQGEKPLHWSHALKSSFALGWNRIAVKLWTQYLQSYLENSISHLAAAVSLQQLSCKPSETDNISTVCQYIVEIWPVLMAYIWKNRVLLAAIWDKISIFHLGQTKHHSATSEYSMFFIQKALWCIKILRKWPSGCQQSLSAWFTDVSRPSQGQRLNWSIFFFPNS